MHTSGKKDDLEIISESIVFLENLGSRFKQVSMQDLFLKICEHLTQVLEVDFAFIGELLSDNREIRLVRGFGPNGDMSSFQYDLNGTPCNNLLNSGFCCYPNNVNSQFPEDFILIDMGIEAYAGIPLKDRDDHVFGVMVLLSRSSIQKSKTAELVLKLFADRVSAELDSFQQQQMLVKSEEKYRFLIENQTDLLVKMDADRNLSFVSDSFCKLFGKTEQELLGTPFMSHIYETDVPAILKGLEGLQVSPHHVYLEHRAKTIHGIKWLGWVETAILDENGKLSGIIGVGRDIEELVNARIELEKSLDQAMESDRLKSVFLATISHELRTPLNAIIGFSDLIQDDLSLEDIHRFSGLVNKAAHSLLAIVNDLFDLTLIQLGEFKLVMQDVNLEECLKSIEPVILDYRKRNNKTEIQLNRIPRDSNDKVMIRTDEARLQQVLLNLLKNALKYTDEGSIKYGFRDAPNKHDGVLFFVQDTGMGIEKSKQEKIFNIFDRVQDYNVSGKSGTGIGLSVANKIVRIMGGRIWVESEPGEGSTFYFNLPFESDQF